MENHLELQPDELAFFFDETGDRRTADPNNSIFAYGGISIHYTEFDHVRDQWLVMKRKHFSNVKGPLHFTRLSRRLSPKICQSISSIFEQGTFGRCGSLITNLTQLNGIDGGSLVCGIIKKYVVEIARTYKIRKIYLIFEEAIHPKEMIQQNFSDDTFLIDGQLISCEGLFMQKSANHPFLEMADWIAYCVSRQLRFRRDNPKGFLPEFRSAYQCIDPRRAKYMQIDAVHQSSQHGAPAEQLI